MSDVFLQLCRLREAGQRGVLVLVVESMGSSPAKAGARMIVLPDGSILGTVGGGALEHHAAALAAEVARTGETRLVPLDLADDLGMSCGGRATIYLEPIGSEPRLYIFGAGHIAVELCDMASRCGFSVVVCDDRDELRTPDRFPRAQRLFGSARTDRLDEVGIQDDLDRAYVVVVTHNHEMDFALVRAIAPMGPVYLGMIGSARKRRALEKRLAEAGGSGDLLHSVRCPAGIALGGTSPAEIALSITAELVALRSAGGAPSTPAASDLAGVATAPSGKPADRG